MFRIAAFAFALLFTSCSATTADVVHLNPMQSDRVIHAQTGKPNFLLIDVRTPEEFAAGRLAKASLIDFKAPDFQQRMAALPRDANILLYCRSGHRSGLAIEALKGLGFASLRDIAGGINEWNAQGLPVER